MGGFLTLEPATAAHVQELARTMREPDVAEVEACGLTPLEMLEQSVANSAESFTCLVDGQVACMFGVAATTVPAARYSIAWILTGAPFARHARKLIRLYRGVVKSLLETRAGLMNYIDCRYEAAIRVAEMAGFRRGSPVPYGPKGLLFCPVFIERG